MGDIFLNHVHKRYDGKSEEKRNEKEREIMLSLVRAKTEKNFSAAVLQIIDTVDGFKLDEEIKNRYKKIAEKEKKKEEEAELERMKEELEVRMIEK